MSFINLYLCLIGTVALRLLIKDNTSYIFSCVLLGVGLGILQGSRS